MMPSFRFPYRFSAALAAACISPAVAAHATKPKLDDATCAKLRVEQTTFLKTGILSDMNKGPDWAKSNLSADRIRDIKHFIDLEEQVRFGCRDAKLSSDAEKASEAAARIEINSDADPLAPVVKDPAKPGAEREPTKKQHHRRHKRVLHKKSKKSAPAPADAGPSKTNSTFHLPAAAQSASADAAASSGSGDTTAGTEPSLPAFGFGKTMVMPAD